MEFRLQVGDVMTHKSWKFTVVKLNPSGFRDEYTSNGKCVLFSEEPVSQYGQLNYFVKKSRTVGQWLRYGATVHRPTPEGLVQVWPEVKEQ